MGYFGCLLTGKLWGDCPSKMPSSHTCWHNPIQHLIVVDTSLLFISYLLQLAYRRFRHTIIDNSLIFGDFAAVGPKFAWDWANYPVIKQGYVGWFQLL